MCRRSRQSQLDFEARLHPVKRLAVDSENQCARIGERDRAGTGAEPGGAHHYGRPSNRIRLEHANGNVTPLSADDLADFFSGLPSLDELERRDAWPGIRAQHPHRLFIYS